MQCKKLVSTKDLSRADWLQWRKAGIGGSDAAAIAGISKYSNSLTVYLDKISDEIGTDNGNEAMEWGNILEEPVAQEFAKRTGFKIQKVNFLLQSHTHPFMFANLDRLCVTPEGKGILEVKTCGIGRAKEWDGDAYPDDYRLQVAHYLAVTQLPFAYLACLVCGQKLEIRRIERDLELEGHLIQIESDFWRMVQAQEMPAIDGSDASSLYLAVRYAKSTEDQLELDGEAAGWASEYKLAAEEVKLAEKRKELAANKIKAMLGEHEKGVCGAWHLKWMPTTTNRLDTDRLKQEQPEIYTGYLKESTSRRLTVTMSQEKA